MAKFKSKHKNQEIDDGIRPYKTYATKIHIDGDDNSIDAYPFENTLGATVTWTEVSLGLWEGTASSPVFTGPVGNSYKVFISPERIYSPTSFSYIVIYHASPTVIRIAQADGVETAFFDLEIRVYR